MKSVFKGSEIRKSLAVRTVNTFHGSTALRCHKDKSENGQSVDRKNREK